MAKRANGDKTLPAGLSGRTTGITATVNQWERPRGGTRLRLFNLSDMSPGYFHSDRLATAPIPGSGVF